MTYYSTPPSCDNLGLHILMIDGKQYRFISKEIN